VTGDLLAGVEDAHLALGHHDAHRFADEPPRHAVAVGVQLDARIGVHAAHELAHLQERRLGRQRSQRRTLVALEARQRRLARRAVDAHVGDLPHPALQMRL